MGVDQIMTNQLGKLIVYSDGGCRMQNNHKGNKVSATDKSAYAYQIGTETDILQLDGQAMYGKTNNQMELQGLAAALDWLVAHHYTDHEIMCVLDSKYVLDGIQSWMPNWKKNNWQTASKKPVANKQEWLKIDALVQQFSSIEYVWVKGHAESVGNNQVDDLLNQKMDELA